MHDNIYYQFAEVEDIHWWFIARRDLIKKVLEKLNLRKFNKALDIGCGTGGNLSFLKDYCNEITGIDFSEIALKLARKKWPGYKFTLGDANKLSSLYESNSLELVTLLNVLYHKWIKNDVDLLKQINFVLQPSGYLILTEPAFMHLWRKHDIYDMGKKRYKLKETKEILNNAGFRIIFSTYFNVISYLPALYLALLNKLWSKDKIEKKTNIKEIKIPGGGNNLICSLMKLETNFIVNVSKIPVGVSLLCVAQKI